MVEFPDPLACTNPYLTLYNRFVRLFCRDRYVHPYNLYQPSFPPSLSWRCFNQYCIQIIRAKSKMTMYSGQPPFALWSLTSARPVMPLSGQGIIGAYFSKTGLPRMMALFGSNQLRKMTYTTVSHTRDARFIFAKREVAI